MSPKMRITTWPRAPRTRRLALWLGVIALFCLAGNVPASVPDASTPHQIIVTNHISIKSGRKWNPKFWFGNEDDPFPPADYRPDDKHRVTKWYFRNPTHNLNFYVIGLADKTFGRSGRYPAEVFNPRQGWNWALCKYRWWRLPFLSYQRNSFRFYFGWRERGNFGIKLTFREDAPSQALSDKIKMWRNQPGVDKGAYYLTLP
jgi:hypothetical protein